MARVLKGLLSKDELALAEKFERGEITRSEYIKRAVALAKARKDGDESDDEMDDDERKLRGAAGKQKDEDDRKGKARKSIWKGVIFGGGDQSAVRSEDIGGQPDRGPRVADGGEDALSREYSDAVMDRIAGAWSRKEGGDPDVIPAAGSGETWSGDTRDITYRPTQFAESRESGYVGGQEVTGGDFVADEKVVGHYVDREGIEPEGGAAAPVALPGGMRIMSPQASGIAPSAGAQFPDSRATTLKRVRKSRTGVFKSCIFGKRGDQADSFLG